MVFKQMFQGSAHFCDRYSLAYIYMISACVFLGHLYIEVLEK